MNTLPCLEEIYDFETEQLEKLKQDIDQALIEMGNGQQIQLPKGVDSYEKFERKGIKLKEALELELDERRQVDDVIGFFTSKNQDDIDMLNDDQFYQPKIASQQKSNQDQKSDYNTQSKQIGLKSQMAETQTNFSNYQTVSDDTKSTNNGNGSSELSKQMFGSRQMNKKEMQQFMKEKLQKTKIASDITSSTAISNSNNFNNKNLKKKASSKPKDFDDTKSTTCASTIYKPNLRKGTAQPGKKQTQDWIVVKNPPDVIKNKKSQSISREQPCTNGSGQKKADQPAVIKDSRAQTQANIKPNKLNSNIYDKPQMKRNNSKPPLPMSKNAAIEISQASKQLASDGDTFKVDKEQQQLELKLNDEDEKEEIQSQYDNNNENDYQTLSCIKSTSIEQYSNTQRHVQDSHKDGLVTNTEMDEERHKDYCQTNDDQNERNSEEEQDEDNEPEEEKYDGGILSQDQEIDEDEEEAFYENPIKDNDFILHSTVTVLSEEQSSRVNDIQEDEQFERPIQISKLLIETQQPKKIRGRVQTYVDDEAVSAQATPKVQQDDLDSNDNKKSLLQKQLEILEKQELQISTKKEPSKRLEFINKITNQDEQQKKLESEQRRELVRQQRQEEKLKLEQDHAKQQNDLVLSSKPQDKIDDAIQKDEKKDEKIDNKPSNLTGIDKGSKPKKKVSKPQMVEKIPKVMQGDDQIVDYSGHYKTFYDIFVGQILDPKNFELSYTARDTRNMYASFVNIMDNNALCMKKKVVFDQAPTEKSIQDYYSVLPNFFQMTGKSLNDLELEMKNRGQNLMIQAMNQQQLKERFQQNKGKDEDDIIRQAQEKANESEKTGIIDVNRESSLFFRVVKNRTEVYDIISRAFAQKKWWNELPHGLDLRNSWNLLWTWSKIKIDISKLLVWQKCNHYEGAKNLSRKDFLKRNIERAQKMSQKANSVFNISPLTFILPKEYVGFLESFSEFEDKEGKYNFWIMKPAAKSRGRGISLINELSQVTYGEQIVVQRYIKNPLLINGYKFDMRIYVLVTSVNPLEVFVYKEGFGRFSTMPFSLDPTDKNNKYIHLTNVSIQKYNVNNSDQDQADLMYGGTKISLQTLKKRVQQGSNVSWDDQLWPQVKEVILKTLVSCQNDIQYNPCCFELFGYDILIDQDFKCWLIEVNSSPSLARETLLDDMVKQKLIDDTIDLVDPVDFDRKRLFEVLERRINEDFKQSTSSNIYNKKMMNRDLTYILNGKLPRKYGDMPKVMGNYERLAPSPLCDSYLKLIGGQKQFGSMGKIQSDPK